MEGKSKKNKSSKVKKHSKHINKVTIQNDTQNHVDIEISNHQKSIDINFMNEVRKLTKKSAFVQEKVRLKSVTAIHQFLQSYNNVEKLELIHCRMLWRGLLSGFLLCDGFDNQQNLAKELAAMFWNIVVPSETEEQEGLGPEENRQCRGEKFVLWMNAFYAELTRQWKLLDKWMLSKFMSLVRYSLHESLKYLYLSYDLTFLFKNIRRSEAIKCIIHSENFSKLIPDDEDDVEAWNLMIEKLTQEKISESKDENSENIANKENIENNESHVTNENGKKSQNTDNILSIIDLYNLMMAQNIILPDGLHTSDIALFHIEVIVTEYMKVIAELVKETNPDAAIEALDSEQSKVFMTILKPYVNIFLKAGSQSIWNKFTKFILEILVQENDHYIVSQMLELLKSSNSKRKDIIEWIKKFESRSTFTKVASSDNPFDVIQQEMEQFTKDKKNLEEERKRRKDKKKRRKEKIKQQKLQEKEGQTNNNIVTEDPMVDIDDTITPETKVKSLKKKENNEIKESSQTKEKVKKSKNEITEQVKVTNNDQKQSNKKHKQQNEENKFPIVESPSKTSKVISEEKLVNKKVEEIITKKLSKKPFEIKKSSNQDDSSKKVVEIVDMKKRRKSIKSEDSMIIENIRDSAVEKTSSKNRSKGEVPLEPTLSMPSITTDERNVLLKSTNVSPQSKIQDKKSVKFSLENNEMRVYKVNSAVVPNIKSHKVDTKVEPGPSILRQPPTNSDKELMKKNKKRKREVEDLSKASKRMKKQK